MKRFSKMVSRTSEVPLAMHISAMSWACKSVGKPGNGWVSTETALRPPPLRATRMPVGFSSISTPVERSS